MGSKKTYTKELGMVFLRVREGVGVKALQKGGLRNGSGLFLGIWQVGEQIPESQIRLHGQCWG
jgi:hypothetical protein